ncbi:S8 family peptidase [Paraflavitalea sp. CAU 1676]|uniref:S8 family peptidase n=1 Tax=Paraflavitalea sp. CAU 1676 TaxID=3032598 RepID=UPI0023D98000|nr:S8 family peptidase [Paraflavitalea sp. CAU 1676]MDF2191726.1 S8 family peptidase [Paraflavitalea sp. CAU 1676]
MRIYFLLALFLSGSMVLTAQEGKRLASGKLSPLLASRKIPASQVNQYWIVCSDPVAFKDYLTRHHMLSQVRGEYAATNLITISCSKAQLDSLILPSSLVRFADILRVPKEEQPLSSFDNSSNQVNLVHSLFPLLTGSDLTVSVKENKPDTADIDLRGRYLSTPLSSPTITQHAGIMSTLIAGGGNSDYTGLGIAWGARLTSSNFASLLPDAHADYQQYHISVQNHSYGTGIENYYGADAAAYDASSVANPTLLHVFSAGNAGNQVSPQGPYAGIAGYANLSGSFKMAKNIITTGAVNSIYQVEALGSKGPGYDGRVKPELVAFGEDGSSGAAATTSGIALLVQQAIKANQGALPPAAVVKAILLNSADDVAAPGIDFQTGYGHVNAYAAVQAALENKYATGSVSNGQTYSTTLTIPTGLKQFKITLCWPDPPAAPNAGKALINDLDLELVNTLTGEVWRPWVLNHFPHIDSLQKLPVRHRDSINNIEQVSLEAPGAGVYRINVKGYSISSGAQPFALSWQADTADHFKWYFPARGDFITGGETNILRWSSTMSNSSPATLEFTTDGKTWQAISEDVDLSTGFFAWTTPDTIVLAQIRMRLAAYQAISDTCVIAGWLKANTGFNCADSFLLSWNRPPGISRFRVYALGERYLVPILTTNDTAAILQKSNYPALYYTVAPLLAGGYEGLKAYTFNYTDQGVACYVKSFLADQVDNGASLRIELGSLYALKKLTVEKLGNQGYQPLQSIAPVDRLTYQLTDAALTRGANTYRLQLLRSDGSVVYSEPESIYFLKDAAFVVYPNPVNAGSLLHILSAEPGTGSFYLYNSIGQQVLQQRLTDLHQTISLLKFQRGLYFYRLRQGDRKVQTGSLFIY